MHLHSINHSTNTIYYIFYHINLNDFCKHPYSEFDVTKQHVSNKLRQSQQITGNAQKALVWNMEQVHWYVIVS